MEFATKDLLDRIAEEGVLPYLSAIAQMCADGSIAVVVYEPFGEVAKLARSLGWDKYCAVPVFRLPERVRNNLAAADRVTAAWLARSDTSIGRVLLLVQGGSLLVNFDPSRGFWLEPGSTDGELAQARN